MKKFLAILALAVMMAVPSLASAQVRAGSIHLSPMVGYFFNDISYGMNRPGEYIGNIGADGGLVYSMGLGYNFTENWGLEFIGSYSPGLDVDNINVPDWSRGDMDVTLANLNAIYHFGVGSPFVPYVTAGAGGVWGSVDSALGGFGIPNYNTGQLNAGLGFKYFFNETVALRVDGRWLHGFSDGDYDSSNNAMVTAGLTFQFGPRSDCVDADSDGVCDDYDKCPGTPAGYRVDSDGCPLTVSIRMDVKFDFDKAVVKQEYMSEVAKVAEFMKAHPNSRTTVEGHTDSAGSDAYNQKLSQRRADAVREVLINTFEISDARLSAIGYGESRPVADNSTDAGRAENRRVVGVVEGADLDEGDYDQNQE